MMKTNDCIKNWVNLLVNGDTTFNGYLRANSCQALGYYFLSYNTPIAKFCGDHFEVATKKYSATTSKQQNILRRFIPESMLVEVEEIKDAGEFPYRR